MAHVTPICYEGEIRRTLSSVFKVPLYLLIFIHQEVIGAEFKDEQTSEQLRTAFALVGLFSLLKVNPDLTAGPRVLLAAEMHERFVMEHGFRPARARHRQSSEAAVKPRQEDTFPVGHYSPRCVLMLK